MKLTAEAKKLIDIAIQEDLGDGDHTSLSTIPEKARGKAKLIVKQNGVLVGAQLAQYIFKKLDPSVEINFFQKDGDIIKVGDISLEVEGNARELLRAERIVLNFMQRLSGIATETKKYVDLISGTKAKVLDTRKTTPGLRYFEKYAVAMGGGANHRMGLYDLIMIKDNHIDFAGGITQAIIAADKYLKLHNKNLKIEIEARSFDEVNAILKLGIGHRIMLDNFSVEDTKEAVILIDGRFETESSGGITFETIRDYALCGVDFISVGALTHQIKSLDLSLKATF